jgi:BirA family biotin operon repressor/biotin-[acetyl-CoA-carboxylase] ligase
MSNIDAAAIRAALNTAILSRMMQLDVFPEIDSTNAWLLSQPAPQSGRHRVAIANHQTAGRGRGGRRWVSAPGSSLCLSIAYTFRVKPGNLSALTLALGVAAVHALRDSGVHDVQLKWPNDIVAGDGKLGGMLAETHGRSAAGATVVLGIGLNLALPAEILASVESDWAQSPVDLHGILGRRVPREALSAAIINHVIDSLLTYEGRGFDAFVDAWRRYDWLRGRTVAVDLPGGEVRGTASGIDVDGALLVRHAARTTRVISGSIRVDGGGSAPS